MKRQKPHRTNRRKTVRHITLPPELEKDYSNYISFLRRVEQGYKDGAHRLKLDENPSQEKLDLFEEISAAFHRVSCPQGILLYGGMATDDWQHPLVIEKLSLLEERHDWRSIPIERVAACLDCQLYLDAEATRFLLPAFMMAELRTKDLCITKGLATWYCCPRDDQFSRERLALLSPEQQHVFSKVMMLIRRHEYFVEEQEYTDESIRLLPWEWDELGTMGSHMTPLDYLYAKGLMS